MFCFVRCVSCCFRWCTATTTDHDPGISEQGGCRTPAWTSQSRSSPDSTCSVSCETLSTLSRTSGESKTRIGLGYCRYLAVIAEEPPGPGSEVLLSDSAWPCRAPTRPLRSRSRQLYLAASPHLPSSPPRWSPADCP